MHTKIILTTALREVIRYHERKVERGNADYLCGGNLLKDAEDLSMRQKRWHFERLEILNDTVRRKTMHIFLSWHQDDRLDNPTMAKIAKEYIQGMGLDKQPYLVYRHHDAVHTHAHIVTTSIRKDGTHIAFWRKEMLHSMELSRQLEITYGLYQAGHRLTDEEWGRLHPAQKLVYGKTPLRPTMNAVLEQVIPVYKYTNIDELNAVLRGYNLEATRGREESIIRRHEGLLYIPLNSAGKREEAYVKASVLRCKPTWRNLQQRFAENHAQREQHRQRLTTAIDWIFYREKVSMEGFKERLQQEKIRLVGDTAQGKAFYIDQLTKTVFDGKTLGHQYAAEGILQRTIPEVEYKQQQEQKQEQRQEQQQRLRHRLDHY